MVWQVLSRPVGFFGLGAIFLILVALCQMNPALDSSSPLFWASGLLILELFRQVVVFYYGQEPKRVDDVPVPKWKSRLLCLLGFALPPTGLLLWLTMDSKSPVAARRIGRAAVRGTLVLGIVGYFATTNWLVNTAIKAIDLAHLKPYNQARIDKMRRENPRFREARRVTEPRFGG